MKLQDYKKLITAAFANNTRRDFADWRDCGGLCMDVTEGLEGAKERLCAENRYADLFDLCSWTYMKYLTEPSLLNQILVNALVEMVPEMAIRLLKRATVETVVLITRKG